MKFKGKNHTFGHPLFGLVHPLRMDHFSLNSRTLDRGQKGLTDSADLTLQVLLGHIPLDDC